MGLIGILIALGLLIWLAYRGWSILLLAPLPRSLRPPWPASRCSRIGRKPSWRARRNSSRSSFRSFSSAPVRQAHGGFGLGGLDRQVHDRASWARALVLAVVLAGAIVTYGGVSRFVAFFVLAPMAHQLFRAAAIPRRLMPAAIALGTTTFTMSALPGTPAIQNAIPMPFFGTTPFAAPGLGFIAAMVMLGFGTWWLGRAERSARAKGEGYGAEFRTTNAAEDLVVRERATTAQHVRSAGGAPWAAERRWCRRSRSRLCRSLSSSRSIS